MISLSVRDMLVALYFEQVSTGKGKVPLKLIGEAYEFGDLEGRLLNGLLDHGLAEPTAFDVDAESAAIALTPSGLMRARDFARAGHKVKKLTTFSDDTTFSDGTRFAAYVPPEEFEHPRLDDDPVDSAEWTGLPSDFTFTEEKITQLVALLNDAEEQLSQLHISNSEKSQVRALVIASRILAEAPEPPADVIWELVNRAAQIAGIAGLFVAVFGLFK